LNAKDLQGQQEHSVNKNFAKTTETYLKKTKNSAHQEGQITIDITDINIFQILFHFLSYYYRIDV